MYGLTNASEATLWVIEKCLRDKHGCDQAERDMDPLVWYIRTGRASLEFLRKLSRAKAFMVARRLHESGSYEEAIQRVKHCIGYDKEEYWDGDQ